MAHELRHTTRKKISHGAYHPLGATLCKDGVNFAIYSKHAREVFLLLFDTPDGEPTDVIRIETRTKYVWHALVHDLRAGQLYGYKIQGDYHPAWGLRFNEYKLLLDPHAKAVTGKFANKDNLLPPYDPESPGRDLTPDLRDNTGIVPRSIVIDDTLP